MVQFFQTKSRRKPKIPSKEEKATKNVVAIARFVSKDSDALVSERCKQSWWNPMQSLRVDSKKYGSLSLRYVKQKSRNTQDHRLEKYKSNFLISEVSTLRNLDRSQEETAGRQRCARSKAWNLAKQKSSTKKTKAAFCSPADEWVLMVRRKPWTPPIWRPWESRWPRTASCKPEKMPR